MFGVSVGIWRDAVSPGSINPAITIYHATIDTAAAQPANHTLPRAANAPLRGAPAAATWARTPLPDPRDADPPPNRGGLPRGPKRPPRRRKRERTMGARRRRAALGAPVPRGVRRRAPQRRQGEDTYALIRRSSDRAPDRTALCVPPAPRAAAPQKIRGGREGRQPLLHPWVRPPRPPRRSATATGAGGLAPSREEARAYGPDEQSVRLPAGRRRGSRPTDRPTPKAPPNCGRRRPARSL